MARNEFALPTPVYADADPCADVIGYARSAPAAVAIYRARGLAVGGVIKCIQDDAAGDPADGWVPLIAFVQQPARDAA